MQKAAPYIQRLLSVKGKFSDAATAEKTALLQQLQQLPLTDTSLVKKYHDCLLFLQACPGNRHMLQLAHHEMERLCNAAAAIFNGTSVQKQTALNGTGIYGTTHVSTFSFEINDWLLQNFDTAVSLHSSGAGNETINSILELLLPRKEYQLVTQPQCSLPQHIHKLTGNNNNHASLRWLLQTLQQQCSSAELRDHLFNQLNVFTAWKLEHPFFNRSCARALPLNKIHFYKKEFTLKNAGRYIRKKIKPPVVLTEAAKKNLLDSARTILALHYREIDTVSYCDPAAVTYFDMGHGISIALLTMLPQHRFSIESYIGYMAFVNSVPAAYGGGWLLGHRCKIGINIFPALRGGNSSLVFAAVLRLYHGHYHANRFVVKPYQFGKNNADGLRSGAFWFYYKLGFRPVTAALKKMAADENEKKQQQPDYRTPVAVLKQFTAAPVELVLDKNSYPVYDGGDISKAITNAIIKNFAGNREKALLHCKKELQKLMAAHAIKIKPAALSLLNKQLLWMLLLKDNNNCFSFTKTAATQLVKLLVAKFGADEREYILQLQKNKKLWQLLQYHILTS